MRAAGNFRNLPQSLPAALCFCRRPLVALGFRSSPMPALLRSPGQNNITNILLAPNRNSANFMAMERPDQMREMFRMQQALNERIGVITRDMSDADKAVWLLNYCRAMSQEIAELTDSVPWKWWAKYQKLDIQNAKVEVVDLFHFLISAAQVLGMSADDVFDAYMKKNAVNFQRQDSGYTQKDENDSKHI
jgi:dimeric dUTPase (all-alpha-NTP-PPase superfamily)